MEEFIFGMDFKKWGKHLISKDGKTGVGTVAAGALWKTYPDGVQQFGSYPRPSSVTHPTDSCPSQELKWCFLSSDCSCTLSTRHKPAEGAAQAGSSSTSGGGKRENKTITLFVWFVLKNNYQILNFRQYMANVKAYSFKNTLACSQYPSLPTLGRGMRKKERT